MLENLLKKGTLMGALALAACDGGDSLYKSEEPQVMQQDAGFIQDSPFNQNSDAGVDPAAANNFYNKVCNEENCQVKVFQFYRGSGLNDSLIVDFDNSSYSFRLEGWLLIRNSPPEIMLSVNGMNLGTYHPHLSNKSLIPGECDSLDGKTNVLLIGANINMVQDNSSTPEDESVSEIEYCLFN